MNADEFAREIDQFAALIESELRGAIAEFAQDAATQIKAGAPVDTGAYRSSIHVAASADAIHVRTAHPAANKLEFGSYVLGGKGDVEQEGTPHPHWRPAFTGPKEIRKILERRLK